MTFREIDNQLEKIYEERRRWFSINKDDYDTIQRREVVFLKEIMLYNLRDSKESRNKFKIRFYFKLYGKICSYLNLLQEC